jgi:hypothetical protein
LHKTLLGEWSYQAERSFLLDILTYTSELLWTEAVLPKAAAVLSVTITLRSSAVKAWVQGDVAENKTHNETERSHG